MGQEMFTHSGIPDFTRIHYVICQSKDYGIGLMTGLFAWISLTTLSRIYFN